jgi:outer membrane lipoprotein-sorting protein
MTYDSAYSEVTMVIHVGDQVRTKKMVSYAEGRNKSFTEFTFPARDKGVKYLKIDDNMWMYLPSVEKIIKIAGHMLRQSMMGSDFSYEDAMEGSRLSDKYNAVLATEETIAEVFPRGTEEVSEVYDCYVLDLEAKIKEVSYSSRRLWVDKQTFIPVREELFARSGKKLKVMTLADIKTFRKRSYPVYFSMQNLLRNDSKTEMFITRMDFNVKVPEDTFTQRNLKQ